MSGPDRIWIAPTHEASEPDDYYLLHPDYRNGRGSEYTRRDPAVLAALPEVQAMIAGAYEAAARLCWAQVKRRAEQFNSAEEGSTQRARWIAGRIQAEELAKAIEAMAPADAIAARDAMIAEAETRALDSVTTLHSVIADIRAATVGVRPMLSDLVQALVSWRDEAVAKEREDCARMVDCGCDKGQKAAVIDAKNSADRARACGQYNCGAEDAAAIRKRGEGKS